MIGNDASTISRHLSTLNNAGVVASRKSGTTVYYRLRMRCIPSLLLFFPCALVGGSAVQNVKMD